MHVINNCFDKIASPFNIWRAWLKYRRGKRNRPEARDFERNLEANLLSILSDLRNKAYFHGEYKKFIVHDPKRRVISTPPVRDHIVHRAVYNILEPYYEKLFSPFSFSCRRNYGTHRAIKTMAKYLRQKSDNYHKECWVLHGDIEKCFDSINQAILRELLFNRIKCGQTRQLLDCIISGYDSGLRHSSEDKAKRGIPLGNLTSQLFINVYLDPLDRFVKEKLKVKKYIRYADDFLIMDGERIECELAAERIRSFLQRTLDFNFPKSHERINKLSQGIEVLGAKFLQSYQIVRPSTIRRSLSLFRKKCGLYANNFIDAEELNSSWQSIRGMLKLGYNYKVKEKFLNTVNLLRIDAYGPESL